MAMMHMEHAHGTWSIYITIEKTCGRPGLESLDDPGWILIVD
jgi:hypothetical protein